MRCEHCGGTLFTPDQDGDLSCFMCGRYVQSGRPVGLPRATHRTCTECGQHLPMEAFETFQRVTAHHRKCKGCEEGMVKAG